MKECLKNTHLPQWSFSQLVKEEVREVHVLKTKVEPETNDAYHSHAFVHQVVHIITFRLCCWFWVRLLFTTFD